MRAPLVPVITWLAFVAVVVCPTTGSSDSPSERREVTDPDSGAELIGTPAPEWTFTRHLRSKPMSLRTPA
jgi:hypothetical protein